VQTEGGTTVQNYSVEYVTRLHKELDRMQKRIDELEAEKNQTKEDEKKKN